MKNIKKILYLILGLSLLAPAFAYATTTIPWSTTDNTSIAPNTINGATPNVRIGSTTSTSQLTITGTGGNVLDAYNTSNQKILNLYNNGRMTIGGTNGNYVGIDPFSTIYTNTGTVKIGGSYGRVEMGDTGFGANNTRLVVDGVGGINSDYLTFTNTLGANFMITSTGTVAIGPGAGINFQQTGTSTFGSSVNGINLTNGCFSKNGVCISGGGSSLPYAFPLTGNATSTLTQFNGGLTAYASSTIGNGTLGLTVSGSATTTGNAYIAGNVGVGTSSPYSKLSVAGQIVADNILATSSTATNYFMGKVGIGTTTSPLGIMTVAGSLVIQGPVGNADFALRTASGNGYWDYSTNNGDGSLDIYHVNTGFTPLFITPADKVGLGGAFQTPLSTTDVFGNLSVGAYAGANAAPANGINVSGSVGIGTASAANKLSINVGATVADGAVVTGSNGPLNAVTDGTNAIQFGLASNNGYFNTQALAKDVVIRSTGQSSNGSLILGVSNNTGDIKFTTWQSSGGTDNVGLVVKQNGYVGIDQSSAATALDVNGLVSGGTFGSSRRNKLDLSGSNSQDEIDFNLAGGQVFKAIDGNFFGTGDIFFQLVPSAGGYGILSTYLGQGMILTTAGANPLKLQANSTDREIIQAAGNTDFVGTIRSTQQIAPTSGVGLELFYDTGVSQGKIDAYDRSGGVFEPVYVDGSSLFLNSSSGGNVGIGSVSVGSTLTVTGKSGTTPFTVASSTGAVLLSVDQAGHIITGGAAAISSQVTSCGGGTPSITGNDQKGTINTGTGVVTSCLFKFNTAYTVAPVCSVNGKTAGGTVVSGFGSVTTSQLTLQLSADVGGGGTITYRCEQ